MDNRTNTIAGWVLGAGIVALGTTIVTGEMFHAERPEKMGYPIEGVTGAEEKGGAAAEQPAAFYLASADPKLGEQVFKKCTACHTAAKGGANGTGPDLWGVVGGPIGHHAAGFAYSPALGGKGGNWDWDSLFHWLKSPRDFAPGTKMTFAGLSKPEDRANVIAYLNTMSDAPKPLPAAPAAAANPAAAAAEQADQGAQGDKAKDQPVLTEAQATPGKNVKDQAAPSVDGRAAQTKK
ncbi:MAG: cytochrome c family protein [Alphaproteobacteria bacterium]|nr:cytochrome c family protein [Alphaproteobacteria bacterium]MBV9373151.1 cytochrome c family protein [Alphaproteobacteria bacterium]MBV9900240.1 cytochrome c family protein [Alphaproteobacteria bacterium]